MNTTIDKPVRLNNETQLLTHLLFNAEVTKLEAWREWGDPQANSTISKLNAKFDFDRWVMNRMAPETRRDGSRSQPIAHYWLNPNLRLLTLEQVNHQRAGQGLPPLEMPPLPRYPQDHPIWELLGEVVA